MSFIVCAIIWRAFQGLPPVACRRDPIDAARLRALLAAHRTQIGDFSGHRVALWPSSALDLAFLLVALDGVAESLLLLPSDHPPEQVAALIGRAGMDCLIVTGARDGADRQSAAGVPIRTFTIAWQLVGDGIEDNRQGAAGPAPETGDFDQLVAPRRETRWIVPTSGTTGTPKLVGHTLATLTRTVRAGTEVPRHRWGLLYDLARFAGLQVFLQAFLSSSPLLFADTAGGLDGQIAALAAAGCTALSATPTLWRKILMSGADRALPLRQVTLGGEIADAAVLAALARAYPEARITHIYASTEAGVGFSVHDRREGFPVDYEIQPPRGIEIKVDDAGLLWLRPARAEQRFIDGSVLLDACGLDQHRRFGAPQGGSLSVSGPCQRCNQCRRQQGVPRRGGASRPRDAGVALVLVRARRSSITGALVEAIIVPDVAVTDRKALVRAVQRHCREHLPAFKAPAIVTVSDALETASTGKIMRDAA